ncbi:alanine--tRNA ligase-related protein [Fictibacillus iocasae]|uniref:Alanine--tRNA ligase-related protein n=1 Tax=Fictibacillus iocasae TaxID=2715437 RepID=A0ABW2NRY2_9BACL
MVEKWFWKDPYATKLNTCLTSVNGNDITLAQTIFYAFSGGQESDNGKIGGYSVSRAQKDGHEIIYTLEDGHSLKTGDEVTVEIDWQRRYRLMRLHFAAEIILELAYRQLPGIEKIGAHIAEDKSRIDFIWGENISAAFARLEKEAHRLIEENDSITSEYSSQEEGRRYWEIDGFARVACGGTHLRTTGEVGNIRLKRNNIGKGKERIEIYIN